jgi:hypothetical protein
MKPKAMLVSLLAAWAGLALSAPAQMPVPPPTPQVQLRSAADLDQLLRPIALYPDPLLAELLPAATLPSEIVLADRYVSGGGDPNALDQQPWDPSVQALARYPTVLKWLDDNLAWTTAVGQAFVYQPDDVMDSIQRLRAQAQALGNLASNPQENVVADDGTIEILPANPDVVYVPVYAPDAVFAQPYYGAPVFAFGVGIVLGPWFNHDFDWRHHRVIVWNPGLPRPVNWWMHRPGEHPVPPSGQVGVWRPRNGPVLGSWNVDRGWGSGQGRTSVTTIRGTGAPLGSAAVTTIGPRPGSERPSATVTGRPAPSASYARPASGALIGVHSSGETRQFSVRGQESREAMHAAPAAPAHSAAPAHFAPPSRSGGGGRR